MKKFKSDEFCCLDLRICLLNNAEAIHFRATLTPLRLLFLLIILLIWFSLALLNVTKIKCKTV